MKTTAPHRAGFTLIENLMALAILMVLSAAVFASLAHSWVMASQDEVNNEVREDVVLTMNRVMRDVQLASNVVPQVSFRKTRDSCLVLRQPVITPDGSVVEDQFHHIVYTLSKTGVGLVRERWTDPAATAPAHQEMISDSIVAVGFLYSGQTIAQVANLTKVRDVEIMLVSARETGLRRRTSRNVTAGQLLDPAMLRTMFQYGAPFEQVRLFIDLINTQRVDVAMSASTGAASMRNRRTLGLKTIDPPAI